MSTLRSEALAILAADRRLIPDEQEFTADRFQPRDAYGVARLFHAVYGDGYPIDTYYIPERLVEENRCGAIRSVVSRTTSGDVISHVALYRSSPPNPRLYEHGAALTLPGYRSSTAFFRANQLLMKLVGQDGIDGFYGEAVCNHTTTQKLGRIVRAVETAVEPALMPARAYETEQSAAGRVGCLVSFRIGNDCRRKLHVPGRYREELAAIMDGLGLDRELAAARDAIPSGDGEMEVKRFDFAGVARCTVTAPGEGLAARLAELERQLRDEGFAVSQFFVDLGQQWCGGVVEQLARAGYSLGGLLPIWFGDDGLLMQKHFVDPDFNGMKILSERGRSLAEMVRRDWERSEKGES